MRKLLISLALSLSAIAHAAAERRIETLSRGVVAVAAEEGDHLVSWRLLADDPKSMAFNLYSVAADGSHRRINTSPITDSTNYLVPAADRGERYLVRTLVDGKESAASQAAPVWKKGYLEVPIQTIDGYRPGDASVADLDGDGDYELVLQQGGRARDNSHAGLTDEAVLDAYEFDGTHLWRIKLGKNIRDGEHYTQFIVYDLNGDGRAELACKTADGTVDGRGTVIGDASKDWRDLDEASKSYGRVLDGPEFLTVFDGLTGAALDTVDYYPTRDPIDGWGGIGGNGGNDRYGNRCDRFLACVAHLDDLGPSLVMCRGVYGRTVLTAWDWTDRGLSMRWVFDSGSSAPPYRDASAYSGMGGHSLSVADVDADGRDEIVYQAMVIDDDGKGLHSSGLRHGDAMHVSDLDPQRPGLEVFTVQENEGGPHAKTTPGAAMRDAKTGEILWSHSLGIDMPHGLAADIDPRHPGCEAWGRVGGLRSAKGEQIGTAPRTTGFAIWWDGDLLRELLSSSRISKWDWNEERETTLLTLRERDGRRRGGRNPCLMGDIIGDWREEVIVPGPDNKTVRLYSTPIPTTHRLTTLMHDPQYRLGIAWQNVVYNKPPHPSFFLGDGMGRDKAAPPTSWRFDFRQREHPAYSEALGHGWEAGSEPGLRQFSIAVPEGNYRVTARFTNGRVPTTTTIKAEVRRLMVKERHTRAGGVWTDSFIVNTRQPGYGSDGREVRLKGREQKESALAWDHKLTLEFIERVPTLRTLEIEAAPELPTIFILGDSTVCDQPNEPYASWGQMLPNFFGDGVAIANHAESGESYSASIGRGRLDKVADLMKPGDYLLLQFAHNDMKERGKGKGAFLNFKQNMKRHIAVARERGGIPVLITPMHRRRFDNDGNVVNSFGDYPEAIRQTAIEEDVPLIDLLTMSATLYEALGPEGCAALFKEGDGTHHNNYGAYQLAQCIVRGIQSEVPAAATWLKRGVRDFDPAKPDPLNAFDVPPSKLTPAETPDGS